MTPPLAWDYTRYGVRHLPNPTPEDLSSPIFNAIWDVIKTWDINVPEYYSGYCGANGSHVKLILNALEDQFDSFISTGGDHVRGFKADAKD